MALIYVTGPAGSGKSTLQREIQSKGYLAVDEDDPKIGAAHNTENGQPESVPPIEERSTDWFNNHEWRVYIHALEELKSKAAESPVFLFGNSLKTEDIISYIDKVIYLKVDDETIRNRILRREDNDYGKSEEEFAQILKRKSWDYQQVQSIEHTVVDATKPVFVVAEQILSTIAP